MSKDYEYFQIIGMDGLEDVKTAQPKKNKKEPVYHKYKYTGPVKRFDKTVISYLDEITIASSAKKAANNIKYKAKCKLGLAANAGGIKLVNHLKVVD